MSNHDNRVTSIQESEVRATVLQLYPHNAPYTMTRSGLDRLALRIHLLRTLDLPINTDLQLLAQQACLSEALNANRRGESLDYLADYAKTRSKSKSKSKSI